VDCAVAKLRRSDRERVTSESIVACDMEQGRAMRLRRSETLRIDKAVEQEKGLDWTATRGRTYRNVFWIETAPNYECPLRKRGPPHLVAPRSGP
jgi:hypothetical protein